MRKLFLLFAILLVAAPAGFAQSEYSNWEFFIGYAHERANNGADRLDARGRAVSSTGATSRVDFVSKRETHHGCEFRRYLRERWSPGSTQRKDIQCEANQIDSAGWTTLQLA